MVWCCWSCVRQLLPVYQRDTSCAIGDKSAQVSATTPMIPRESSTAEPLPLGRVWLLDAPGSWRDDGQDHGGDGGGGRRRRGAASASRAGLHPLSIAD